jgi:NAD(P)H-hydrate epimerase
VERVTVPLVLDADGINAVAEHIHSLDTRRGRLTVLTPHDGEFLRLTRGKGIGPDREAAASAFARQHGCVLVLKGHRTITAFPDGETFVNTTGNPGMAKGGSGDVLAGMILSLLGQGIDPKRAVPAAVWLHGRAGDLAAARLGEYGMTPSDLLQEIPFAIQDGMSGEPG